MALSLPGQNEFVVKLLLSRFLLSSPTENQLSTSPCHSRGTQRMVREERSPAEPNAPPFAWLGDEQQTIPVVSTVAPSPQSAGTCSAFI
jgi:hypothetical protein